MDTVLFLAANPLAADRLRLDREYREIEEGLRRAKLRDRFELRSRWATHPRDWTRAMHDEQPTIVHFSGHGEGELGLMLEGPDGRPLMVPTDALETLFKLTRDHVRCVVLNACYSEVQARAICLHVDRVIGMSRAFNDNAAVEFAVGFYDALGAGKTVDAAFQWALTAIRMSGNTGADVPRLLKRSGSM